jgi:HK97 family phage prohead protease
MTDFNFILPLNKNVDDTLTGIASTTSLDRDDERMSEQALKDMVYEIKKNGVNLHEDHQHGWQNTLGVIKDAELINNQVQVKINLDDPSTNPKIPALLNKMKRGIRLGLSVGGNVQGFKWEYDRTAGKKIKVLDKVKIYEVSVVGIPSNADSYLSIPEAIAKSAKQKHGDCYLCDGSGLIKEEDRDCPRCDGQGTLNKSKTDEYCPRCSKYTHHSSSGDVHDPDASMTRHTATCEECGHNHTITSTDTYDRPAQTHYDEKCPSCYNPLRKGVCNVCYWRKSK